MSDNTENLKIENPIAKRIALKAYCEFASPALIGSGLCDNTDNDILRDKNGNSFLPGSTVAGAVNFLVCGIEELFGKPDRISPLWVYDADLKNTTGERTKIVELDGVEISKENKVAIENHKYNYEAVETGTKFTLRFLLTIRERDNGDELESQLRKLIGALKSSGISFGAKTRRGFGAVSCSEAVKQEFDLSKGNPDALAALRKWLEFDWDLENERKDQWAPAASEGSTTEMEAIYAELKLDGSIMIRDTQNIYEDLPKGASAPDYMHISSNSEPVILGTSWAGAFRSGLYRLLKQKYPNIADEYIKKVFGYVRESIEGSTEKAEVSKIVFGASFLTKTDESVDGYRSITRVKIDRFTGGAAQGALFTEKPWYGGKTTLEIRYPKDDTAIRELALLGLDALDKGIIQIGGETSVGRGFFKVLKTTDENGKDVSFIGPKLKLKEALDNNKKAGESA